MNLLEAYAQAGDAAGGEKLLHRMMLVAQAPWLETLLRHSHRFSELTAEVPRPEPVGEIEIEIVRLEFPIWMSGLEDARWLLRPEDPAAPQVHVVALANTTPRGDLLRDEAIQGPEDSLGRWTRAIPLHLSDSLRLCTNARVATLLPVVKDRGMMVAGSPWDAESIERFFGDADWIVTGSVALIGEEVELQLEAWPRGASGPALTTRERGLPDDLRDVYLRCENAILLHLCGQRGIARTSTDLPRDPGKLFRPYLDGLGQTYAIALSAREPKESSRLYGERHIQRWMLRLALDLPEAAIPKIALLSTLANGRRRGSDIYREFERETLALLAKVPRSDAELYKLTPFVFRLFDRTEERESRRNELMKAGGDEYVAWLARIETAF